METASSLEEPTGVPAGKSPPRPSSESTLLDDATAAEPGNEAESLTYGCVRPAGGVRAASAAGTRLTSSRFKGVVPQPNGRWGAQIYERHRRVWLGTFATEGEAARVYDVAARRFRGGDAVVNFRVEPADEEAAAEGQFLVARSKCEVVDMLRKHTYYDELAAHSQRLRAAAAASTSSSRCGPEAASPAIISANSGATAARELLFEKCLTPSDVGKLNRLVIPKQHAEKHFPLTEVASVEGASKGLLLSFEDASSANTGAGGNGRVWRFRYSYWNSSQSYVLTKGWSRFVRDKGLKAGDVVAFFRSAVAADADGRRQLYIECKPRVAADDATTSAPVGGTVVRLFGVDILKLPPAAPHVEGEGAEAVGWKRKGACDSPGLGFKKQQVEFGLGLGLGY